MARLTLLDSLGLSLNIQTSISAYEKGERLEKAESEREKECET